MAWQQQNPLAKFDKTRSWVNTDSYIDKAILTIIDTSKLLEDGQKTPSHFISMFIINVDTLETIMLGLGRVQKGMDSQGNKYPYQEQIEKAKNDLETESIKNMPGIDAELLKKQKWANLKFQILLSAVQKSKPMNVEMTG